MHFEGEKYEPGDADEALQIMEAKANPEKFRPLYDRYYKPIFLFVYQRLHDKDEAFDMVSQVFLKAMLNIKTYEYRGFPFSSWLYRIARNELNMLFRKQKGHREVNLQSEDIRQMIDECEEDFYEEKINQVLKALEDLSERDMELIEMRYFEKRSFKEIGKIMNITENNAKVKVYRILDKIKEKTGNPQLT